MEDPFKQGEIACCNVLSDVYAMGVTHIDNILMVLGVSLEMKEKEREIVTREIMRGFNSKAIEAGTLVTGGQSVMNPWPIIGGTAISVVPKSDVKYPNYAKPGDVLVLTKPLGTQVIVNTVQWLTKANERWEKSKLLLTEEELWDSYTTAQMSMSRLNKNAAELMAKYNSVGACTDITGFGLKGHLENLVVAQVKSLKFVVNKLPVINKSDLVNNDVFNFKLLLGYSAETSGGLLIAMNRQDAELYLKDMHAIGEWAWIIGEVLEGERTVEIQENSELIYI